MHIFGDEAPGPSFARLVADRGAFGVPTTSWLPWPNSNGPGSPALYAKQLAAESSTVTPGL